MIEKNQNITGLIIKFQKAFKIYQATNIFFCALPLAIRGGSLYHMFKISRSTCAGISRASNKMNQYYLFFRPDIS